MVMMQRRSVQTTWQQRSSTSSIAYGDGNDCGMSDGSLSSAKMLHRQSSSPRSFSFSSPRHRGQYSTPAWIGNLVKGMILLSWIAAIFITKGTWQSYSNMHNEEQQLRNQYNEDLKVLDDAKLINKEMKNHVSEVLQARKVMKHESHTALVLNAAGEDTPQLTQPAVVTAWLDKRKKKLEDKVVALTKLVSEESRNQAIEKFGAGPHRVEIKVHFIESDRIGTFVVEMAPLHLMPHAVNTFLRQVDSKLWDNTVFWHHDGIDHIISAAPTLFGRGDTKHHHFEAMGVRELSFAEYSPEYPHEQFTLGFTDRGPNFYINAMDNTRGHGPGGQKERPEDHADPCFGKIVDGLDTIREMYKLQLRQSSEAVKKHEWHDDEVTKIVSATILK